MNIYDGNWKNNKLLSGKIIYPNDKNYDSYEGEIFNFLPYGIGTMKYKDGSVNTNLSHNLIFTSLNNKYYLSKKNNDGKINKTISFPKEIKNINELKNQIYELATHDLSEEEIENLTCPISLEIMIEPIKTSCGHTFCKYSIDKCDLYCSLCRAKITNYLPNLQLMELYNKCRFKYFDIEMSIEDVRTIYQFLKEFLPVEKLSSRFLNNWPVENWYQPILYDRTNGVTNRQIDEFSETSSDGIIDNPFIGGTNRQIDEFSETSSDG
jgi:hypothetical protein